MNNYTLDIGNHLTLLGILYFLFKFVAPLLLIVIAAYVLYKLAIVKWSNLTDLDKAMLVVVIAIAGILLLVTRT